MRAILLAAGLGTRLRPLTDHLPKCMVPVNGRPLLQYWLDALFDAGIEAVLVNLHHRSELVEAFLNAHPQRERIKLVREERLLGTGGTLLENRDFGCGGSLMLIHGDNLCGADLRLFISTHMARKATLPVTMMTFVTDRPKECGVVVADTAGVVREFHEKAAHPPGNLASAAVFILEPSVYIDHPEAAEGFDFSRDVLPGYVGRIGVFHNDRYHRDLGNVQAWLSAQTDWNGSVPAPLSGDPWCGYVDRLPSTTGVALRSILESALERIGAREIREFQTLGHELNLPTEVRPDRPPFYFFWRVPSGFSSRAFFEAHGVRSLAMASRAKA
jgi:mannose-1-phosphate guanylyltransferase